MRNETSGYLNGKRIRCTGIELTEEVWLGGNGVGKHGPPSAERAYGLALECGCPAGSTIIEV